MAHYLDEPLVLIRVQLEEVQRLLGLLADAQRTPLPLRLLRQCTLMLRTVDQILREVRTTPEALLRERLGDGPPWSPTADV